MCVDYQDLDRVSSKDNFPLLHIDVLVDNIATNVVFSFMDGFSSYNQIKMTKENKPNMAFTMHQGTYAYEVISFGLKNAEATYQQAMVTFFHDMKHKEVKVYKDVMITKSLTHQDHLTDLHKLFKRLKNYLRLNQNKCVFGVGSRKLWVLFSAKEEQRLIQPRSKKEKQVCSFLGRINYIAQLIALLTTTSEPLFKFSKKNTKLECNEDCQKTFEKIKEYLLNPPILIPPTPGIPLILFLPIQEMSVGCMLGQQDESGIKEKAIYCLSKKLIDYEGNYTQVKKTCCALAWVAHRLR